MNLQKNILDLEYQRTLQFLNTIIVISITYIISLTFAFLSKQITYKSNSFITLMGTSIFFFILALVLFLKYNLRLKEIISKIKELEYQ